MFVISTDTIENKIKLQQLLCNQTKEDIFYHNGKQNAMTKKIMRKNGTLWKQQKNLQLVFQEQKV